MAGRTDGLIKNFRAGVAIPAFTIVKFGATDVEALPASAAADASVGITGELAASAAERVDVHMGEIGDVRFGGPVTRGDPLTSDASGRAILAAPGANVTMRIIGFAMVNAVLGDVGPARIVPGFVRG